MTDRIRQEWPIGLIIFFLTGFYLWGLGAVPFHPDEATQLYMSSDFEALLGAPQTLFWQANPEDAARQRYRELDAPLTRYLIGLGRVLGGQAALPADWDWGQTWDENIQTGAYPNEALLLTGRVAIAALLPVSLVLIYAIGKQIQGRSLGVIAVLLLGTHAVILLHGRRAMAEGPLIFGVLLAVWSFIRHPQRAWLAGLSMALAFNSKQSALALLPVGLIAVGWAAFKSPAKPSIPAVLKQAIVFGLVFVGASYVLNPVHWNAPHRSIPAAVAARQQLLTNQIADLNALAPEKVLQTPTQRIVMLIANIFVGPAEHSLIGNLAPTFDSVATYIATPGHHLLRGLIWGSLMFGLFSGGFLLAMRKISSSQAQFASTICLLATGFQATGLLIAVPLPWVRFTIPLIPFICLWMAYPLAIFWKKALVALKNNRYAIWRKDSA